MTFPSRLPLFALIFLVVSIVPLKHDSGLTFTYSGDPKRLIYAWRHDRPMKSLPATRFKPAGPKSWRGLGTLPQRERSCAASVSLDIILSIFLSLSDAGNLVTLRCLSLLWRASKDLLIKVVSPVLESSHLCNSTI